MPLLKRSPTSERSNQHPRLPRLSDAQYNEIEEKAHRLNIDLSRCPTCNTGHEKPAPGVDLGWPLDSRYLSPLGLLPCDCEWQDTLRRRYLLADIPALYWRYDHGDFYGDSLAMQVADDYLTNWSENKRHGLGLEFHSVTQGTGKTFLITYIARKLIQSGESVYYRPFREIMGLYQLPREESKPIQERLTYSTVLALDEVGSSISGAQGEYFAMEFENLIRTRIDNNLVTLMTTNLLPDELDELYPRTYSLLSVKQKRHAIDGIDVRREGQQDIDRQLAENGEVRPIS